MSLSTKKELDRLHSDIQGHQDAIKRLRLEVDIVQMRCPHSNRKRWTNNDGDGQFIVERCLDCGLQKDGGLGESP